MQLLFYISFCLRSFCFNNNSLWVFLTSVGISEKSSSPVFIFAVFQNGTSSFRKSKYMVYMVHQF